MTERDGATGRRQFLQAGLGALAMQAAPAAASGVMAPGGKPWRGLFPIGQTPFTADDKLDLDCLAAEIKFCNRARIPGFLWPQSSSSWTSLSEKERLAGAECIMAAGKGGMTSLIIGVQSKGGDIAAAIRYAKHAAQHGADGIVSMVPGSDDEKAGPEMSDATILEYFKTIGAASNLPLMVQSHGTMSVDLIVRIYNEVPTVKAVKDEAGDPLARIGEFRRRTDNKMLVFYGNGAIHMIDALRLGFDGYIPKTGLADLSQAAYELWNAGKHKDAFDMFGRVQAFQTIPGAMEYLLTARGVFKEDTTMRESKRLFGTNGIPDQAQRKIIRQALEQFLRPYLRA